MSEWRGLNIWPCWSASGYWEDAADWSVRDARVVTRNQARAAASYDLDFTDIRVWKRFLRPFSIEESWEHTWRSDEGQPRPEGWYPDEAVPVWEFCKPAHPEAIPVWIVGAEGDRPPQNPARSTPTENTQ